MVDNTLSGRKSVTVYMPGTKDKLPKAIGKISPMGLGGPYEVTDERGRPVGSFKKYGQASRVLARRAGLEGSAADDVSAETDE